MRCYIKVGNAAIQFYITICSAAIGGTFYRKRFFKVSCGQQVIGFAAWPCAVCIRPQRILLMAYFAAVIQYCGSLHHHSAICSNIKLILISMPEVAIAIGRPRD